MKLTSKIYAKEILDEINNNINVVISRREKNKEFIEMYGLTLNDVKECLLQLNQNKFVEKIRTKDRYIKSEYLYVFCTNLSLIDKYGESIVLQVYIKICKVINKKDTIFVVSFHD